MARRGLMEQDLSKLDVDKLTPLSPEVISRQATINIVVKPGKEHAGGTLEIPSEESLDKSIREA